jgi:hypothetical protein
MINNFTGPATNFSTASMTGNVTLTANATLDGVQVSSFASITIIPGLNFVSASPAFVTLPIGGTQEVTASIVCSGGTCPAGVSYAWSLSNPLGTINTTTGPSVLFTANSSVGTEMVIVNATLGNLSAVAASTITIVPSLTSLSVSPPAPLLAPGGVQTFTASITCTGGNCPSGAKYAWALAGKSLGTLNDTNTSTVTFTAGSVAGTESLTVFVELTSQIEINSATITISKSLPTLVAITASPLIAMVQVGRSLPVNATATCSPGPCPTPALTYSWALSAPMGNVSPTSGPSTTFTAAYATGSVRLVVTGDLYGIILSSATAITISATTVPRLTAVVIVPGAMVGRAQALSASASCSPGPCPGFVTYQWSVNNTLGSLSATSGSNTTFTEGNGAGLVSVTLTASLDSRSVSNSTVITILPVQPTVVKVTVTPSTASVRTGGKVTFVASAVCFPTAACPSSLVFSWSVSNSLGKVSQLTGNSTVFTAGGHSGTVSVTLTASLGSGQAVATATITVSQPPSSESFLGLPGLWGYVLVGVVAIAIVVVAVAIHSRGGKKEKTASPAQSPSPEPGKATATPPAPSSPPTPPPNLPPDAPPGAPPLPTPQQVEASSKETK